METKICSKFLESAIFYDRKWPTSVTESEFLKQTRPFSISKFFIKVEDVFYGISKLSIGKK